MREIFKSVCAVMFLSLVGLGGILVLGAWSPEVPVGHSLTTAGGAVGVGTNAPGSSIGLIYLPLGNVGGRPITLERAVLRGRGLGTVVRVIHLEVDTVPAAFTSYVTYPPAWGRRGGACRVAKLVPVQGTVLPANSHWQAYVALHYVRPGGFGVRSADVYYRTADGQLEHQVEDIAISGRVSAHSSAIPVRASEKPCLRRQKTGLLPEPYRERVLGVLG